MWVQTDKVSGFHNKTYRICLRQACSGQVNNPVYIFMIKKVKDSINFTVFFL